MNRRRIAIVGTLLASSAALSACAALNGPVVQPNQQMDATIQTGFMLAQTALIAVSVIPGLPPIAAIEAGRALNALQAAYTAYKAVPAGSTEAQAAMLAAIQAANSFLQANSIPTKLAAMPGARAARMTLVR